MHLFSKINRSYCILFISWILATLLSWYSGVGGEDLLHMGCRSLDEAYYVASQAYLNYNSRLGEMSLYFLGIDSTGAGGANAIWFYRIFNPLFIITGILMLYRLGTGYWPDSTKASIFSITLLCVLVFGCRGSIWWLCGNTSWTYPFIIALIFFGLIEPYFSGNFKIHAGRFLGALMCTPIVGMSNENTSIVSLGLLTITGIWYMYKHRSIRLSYQYWILFFSLFCFVILFYCAPGRMNRAENTGWVLSFENILFNSLSNPAYWTYVLLLYWRNIILILLLLFFIPRHIIWQSKRTRLLLLTWSMLSAILIAAPCWGGPRSFIPPELLLYAVFTFLIYNLAKYNQKRLKIYTVTQLLLCSTLIFPIIIEGIDSYYFWNNLKQKAILAQQREDKTLIIRNELHQSIWPIKTHIPRTFMEKRNVTIPLFPTSNIEEANNYKWGNCEYITKSASDYGMNKGIAKMFNLRSIIYIKD